MARPPPFGRGAGMQDLTDGGAQAQRGPSRRRHEEDSGRHRGRARPAPRSRRPTCPGAIDGLRGWPDQIERRQARMTYVAAAGSLIAAGPRPASPLPRDHHNQDMAPRTTSTRSRMRSPSPHRVPGRTQTQIKALSRDQITALPESRSRLPRRPPSRTKTVGRPGPGSQHPAEPDADDADADDAQQLAATATTRTLARAIETSGARSSAYSSTVVPAQRGEREVANG